MTQDFTFVITLKDGEHRTRKVNAARWETAFSTALTLEGLAARDVLSYTGTWETPYPMDGSSQSSSPSLVGAVQAVVGAVGGVLRTVL